MAPDQYLSHVCRFRYLRGVVCKVSGCPNDALPTASLPDHAMYPAFEQPLQCKAVTSVLLSILGTEPPLEQERTCLRRGNYSWIHKKEDIQLLIVDPRTRYTPGLEHATLVERT